MKKFLLSFLGVCVYACAMAQAPTINASLGSNEYGTSNAFNYASGATTWHATSDANYLYVFIQNANETEAAIVYLDLNPGIPVNAATGSIVGNAYDGLGAPFLPFSADAVVYFKNNYRELRRWNGSSWVQIFSGNIGGGTNDYADGTYASNTNGNGAGNDDRREIRISWCALTGGSSNCRPAVWNMLGYIAYTNGMYAQIPVNNATGPVAAGTQRTLYYYFSVVNNTISPFTNTSFTQHDTQAFTYTNSLPATLYDLTIYDNQPDGNADNTTASSSGCSTPCENFPNRVLLARDLTLDNSLYIGAGSALFPQVGSNVKLTFAGNATTFYNEGRLDCTPTPGSNSTRRLRVDISEKLTLQASSVPKALYRFSDVTLSAAAEWNAPSSGNADIECQYGSLINNGTIDFGNGITGGTVTFGLRGSVLPKNIYEIGNGASMGIFKMNNVLVGFNSSELRPVNTATNPIVTLQVQGDFANYQDFTPTNGSGIMKIVMNGGKKQRIMGEIGQTTNNKGSFHSLEIANTFGDVHFETDPSSISYDITNELKMTSGNLVTRNSSFATPVHVVTMKQGSSLLYTGAQSGSSTSCFIDGPLTWEVATAGITVLHFPTGKGNGASIRDYRHVQLAVTHSAATPVTYAAEMFLGNCQTCFTAPLAVGEDLAITTSNISAIRYWDISSSSAGAPRTGAVVTLAYNTSQQNDDFPNASEIRIVKSNSSGAWENISPGTIGGTNGGSAPNSGTITSQSFTTFSTFALAKQPIVLPDRAVSLRAYLDTKRTAQLVWTSHSPEKNSLLRYVIQRSTTSMQDFEEIGSRSFDEPFMFSDENLPPAERVSYRIAATDADGGVVYSDIETLQIAADESLRWEIFPNPIRDALQVRLYSPLADGEISLVDALGRTVQRIPLHADMLRFEINTQSLAAGVYTALLHYNGEVVAQRVVKNHTLE